MKPEPIVLNVDTEINLNDLSGDEGAYEHHSLYLSLLKDVAHALGGGTGFHWVGDTEGLITFRNIISQQTDENTSLVSGATGATNYLQVTATYTAPEATFIVWIYLRGTRNSRSETYLWSEVKVNQPLENGQDYMVNWTLHADI